MASIGKTKYLEKFLVFCYLNFNYYYYLLIEDEKALKDEQELLAAKERAEVEIFNIFITSIMVFSFMVIM